MPLGLTLIEQDEWKGTIAGERDSKTISFADFRAGWAQRHPGLLSYVLEVAHANQFKVARGEVAITGRDIRRGIVFLESN